MMTHNKGISALGYLSTFFAPIIVPIIIFFASKEEFTKHHAKRALLSQLVPIVLSAIFGIYLLFAVINVDPMIENDTAFLIQLVIVSSIFGILCLAYSIWTIVQTVKVLK